MVAVTAPVVRSVATLQDLTVFTTCVDSPSLRPSSGRRRRPHRLGQRALRRGATQGTCRTRQKSASSGPRCTARTRQERTGGREGPRRERSPAVACRRSIIRRHRLRRRIGSGSPTSAPGPDARAAAHGTRVGKTRGERSPCGIAGRASHGVQPRDARPVPAHLAAVDAAHSALGHPLRRRLAAGRTGRTGVSRPRTLGRPSPSPAHCPPPRPRDHVAPRDAEMVGTPLGPWGPSAPERGPAVSAPCRSPATTLGSEPRSGGGHHVPHRHRGPRRLARESCRR